MVLCLALSMRYIKVYFLTFIQTFSVALELSVA